METYLARLRACGMRLDDALVLIDDFLRDGDWEALEDYTRTLERLCG